MEDVAAKVKTPKVLTRLDVREPAVVFRAMAVAFVSDPLRGSGIPPMHYTVFCVKGYTEALICVAFC